MDPRKAKGTLEIVLSALAFLFSLMVTIRIWILVAPRQEMWPLPALYLLEAVALPAAYAATILGAPSAGGRVASTAAGAVLAFSILGAWSVGLLYAPLVVLLLAAAWAARARRPDRLPVLFACFLAGAVAQSSIMLLGIRLL